MKRKMFVFSLTALLLTFLCVLSVSATEVEVAPGIVRYSSYDQRREVITPASESGVKRSAIPSSYNLVTLGRTTPIRDQGQYGTCWAFSATAASESSLITEFSNCTPRLNLSELHLARYTFAEEYNDALGLTKGDRLVIDDGSSFLDFGGDDFLATFSYAKWIGAAKEEVMPYSSASPNMPEPESLRYQKDFVHLENAYWISMTNVEAVKETIMKLGAASTGVMYDYDYLNYDLNALYCTDYDFTNHAVTIVGWDDNYPRSNFNGSINGLPSRNGAWLIKNSYGEEYGINGYFWLSYEDVPLQNENATFFDYAAADKYKYNYQYDGAYDFSSYKFQDSEAYAANVFVSQNDELLKAVGFVTYDPDTKYKIEIYTGCTAGEPYSGTLVSSATVSGMLNYAGYYTIELSEPVPLPKGTRYTVSVCTEYVGFYSTFTYVPVDGESYLYGETAINITNSARGQSFIGYSKDTMEDLIDYGYNDNTRIKAFTDTLSYEPTAISVNPATKTLAVGQKSTLKINYTPFYAKDAIVWSSSNTAVASVNSSTGLVTARSAGSAVITAKTSDGSLSSSCKLTVVSVRAVSWASTSNVGTSSYRLIWGEAYGAEKYQIFVYNPGTKKFVLFKTVTGKTNFTVTGRQPGERLAFKVRGYRMEGGKMLVGEYSPVINARTRVNMGNTLRVTSYTSSTVNLSWTRVSNEAFYRVYIRNGTTGSFRLLQEVGSAKSALTVYNRASGWTYQFKIVAVVKSGNNYYEGAPSQIVTVRMR